MESFDIEKYLGSSEPVQAQDRGRPEKDGAGEAITVFARALAYSAIQTPIDGLSQLANSVSKPLLSLSVPRIELIAAPQPVEFGSTQWVARLTGGGLGTILPFWFGGKLAVKGMESLSASKLLGPSINASGILRENSIAQLAFKGAVYEGIFHPVNENSGRDFWTQRGINFAAGGLSFMAMGYASKSMRGTAFGDRLLSSRVPLVAPTTEVAIDAVSGATAGVADSSIHSLLDGKLPNARQLSQSAGEYALLSAFLKLGRMPVEKAAEKSTETVAEPPPATGKRAGEQTNLQNTDPINLRPTLPYDKPANLRQRIVLTELELQTAKYQMVHHRGQQFAIDRNGHAYEVNRVNGQYELVLTDKMILDRLNEVQVPWPPIQINETYRARDVIHLNQLFASWMKDR